MRLSVNELTDWLNFSARHCEETANLATEGGGWRDDEAISKTKIASVTPSGFPRNDE